MLLLPLRLASNAVIFFMVLSPFVEVLLFFLVITNFNQLEQAPPIFYTNVHGDR